MPSAQAQRLEVMLTTISHLADRVFSPVLAKQAELNRMKRVLGVLGRHRHVFTLPGSMQRAAQAREYVHSHISRMSSIRFCIHSCLSTIIRFCHLVVWTKWSNCTVSFGCCQEVTP